MAWFIAFLEGASTLAVEVIAIRLAVPVVGSSATLTGVTLAVVLLALSAGYWRGGMLSARWDSRRTQTALGRNLLLAAGIYGVASFPLEANLLEKTLDAGLDVTLAIGLTALGLFLLPVYLASQTVPMLAELTNSEGKAGKASGRILFFSTLGSVVGGILTPVLLFPCLGVQRTTYGVCVLLVVAGCAALGRSRFALSAASGVTVLALVVAAHIVFSPREPGFSFDSAYQSFRVVTDEDAEGRAERVLLLGGGRASGVYLDDGATSFAYVRETEKALSETQPSDVLVIGAAGFTFPRDAARVPTVQRVDAVDLDPAVKRIAETEFLGEPLDPKIRFLPMSARYALHKLRRDGNHYGFAFVDAYYGKGIPPELLTVEFFSDVNAISDRTVVNVIMDGTLASAFANNLLASFREAFHGVWVKPLMVEDQKFINVLVSNWPVAGSNPWNGRGIIYHDDKNTADRDWIRLLWRRAKS
jgi:predicted membrane-bound spermidine synthase